MWSWRNSLTVRLKMLNPFAINRAVPRSIATQSGERRLELRQPRDECVGAGELVAPEVAEQHDCMGAARKRAFDVAGRIADHHRAFAWPTASALARNRD